MDGPTLRLALKVLLRRKFFTFVSLFAVAFTLLVLVVAAALLDHVFGPHAPEDRPGRTLLALQAQLKGEQSTRTGFVGWKLLDRTLPGMPGVERSSVFSMPSRIATYHDGRKVVVYRRRADGEFWRVFRFRFVEGAPYGPLDEAEARPVAVLNESTRERYFGRGPAVGKSFELDGRRYRVVGVVADVPFTRFFTFGDVWVPISTSPSQAYRRDLVGDFVGAMLLAPGADAEAVRAEFTRRVATIPMDDPRFERLAAPADRGFDAIARLLFEEQLTSERPARLRVALLTATLLFMALPALNLVNVNLSRILERASEIGVRKAFGATSGALVRQFLVENVVLTAVGAVAGTALATLVLAGVNRSGMLPYSDLSLNLRVLAWGVVLALAFGLLSGVLPAWRMSRLHPVGALSGRMP